jgi:hypothetical protein
MDFSGDHHGALGSSWRARVGGWDQVQTQRWVLFVVGVSELDAAKVTWDGARLLSFDSDTTAGPADMVEALRGYDVSEGAARAIASTYQAQQWTIHREVS